MRWTARCVCVGVQSGGEFAAGPRGSSKAGERELGTPQSLKRSAKRGSFPSIHLLAADVARRRITVNTKAAVWVSPGFRHSTTESPNHPPEVLVPNRFPGYGEGTQYYREARSNDSSWNSLSGLEWRFPLVCYTPSRALRLPGRCWLRVKSCKLRPSIESPESVDDVPRT